MRLTLIRHGQTPSNVAGLLDTAPPGPGLTVLGRSQAAAIPAVLDGLPIDALFASNQLRAQQTAHPLATTRGLTTEILPGLREIAAGQLEMAGDHESVHRYIGILYEWFAGDLDRRIPGGPSGREMLERYDAAIDQIIATVGTGGSAVAVSHGAAIRVWAVARAAGFPTLAPDGRHLDNTGAVTLERDSGGRWAVLDWRTEALGGALLDRPASSGPAT